MNKNNIYVIIILFLIASSCKKNKSNSNSTAYTPDCTGTTPTFAASIQPLILSSCASSGCHSAGSSKGPGALTTFAEIKNSMSSIRSSVVSGRMPQGSTLTTDQKNKIVCWIDAGAPNN